MSVARGPIKRPILTVMVTLIVITIGIVAFTRIPIDLMPEITWPSITVRANYGNVGPQEMEQLVTKPIEEAIAAVDGVKEISSTSTEGASRVRISFDWGRDLEAAVADVRERIDRIVDDLPEDVERPRIFKFDFNSFPVVILGAASSLNPVDLRQLVEDQVKYRLERLPGVAAVDIWGGLRREIHVNLDSDKVKALDLSTNRILQAIRAENRTIPAGTYKTGNFEILIRTEGEYTSLDEIRNTVVAMRGDAPIRVGDFASVRDAWEEVTRLVRVNGEPALRLAVRKQSGANTVQVADAVRAEMARINSDMPQLRLISLRDTSVYIRNSIENVGRATLLGGILAVIILFLFLRSLSSTAIIATAIPVSILATFALIYFGGYTLNLMTFGGLALGIGMLVDNSIVVLENIYRKREQGLSSQQSALEGTSEVGAAIVASTLTTLVVFLPVVFMRGLSGIYYQQLAVVVAFSLLCSLAVALTLVPMMASRLPERARVQERRRSSALGRFYRSSEELMERAEAGYVRRLGAALKRKAWILGGAALLFVLSLALIPQMGVEFMPPTDEGEVDVNIEMAVGTRLEVLDQVARTVEAVVERRVPEAEAVRTSIGSGGWGASGGHTGSVEVTLVPLDQRERSSEEVAADLRQALSGLPGATIRVRPGRGFWLLRIGQGGSDSVTLEVRGFELETARQLAVAVRDAVEDVPGITDTRISREEGRPEQVLRIDRAKAADLGLTVSAIGEALRTAVGGSYASNYREGGREYRIRVRLEDRDRKSLQALLDLTVTNRSGQPVVLRNVVEAVPVEGPVRIERKDQERTVFVTAHFAGRPQGDVVADLRAALRTVPVPKDFAVFIGGDWEEQQEAFRELRLGLILAIVLVFMVMAAQFESLVDPLIVLFSVPMAVIGVVLTMLLTGTPFSINAYIGAIMLGGIIVNNAILLVDYTNLLRRRDGLALNEAVMLGARRRLRPILMTTLTTILGLFPLSLGLGEGGETQAPLARVVIGGLASATLVTLVLIPVMYTLLEGLRVRLRRRREATGTADPAPQAGD